MVHRTAEQGSSGAAQGLGRATQTAGHGSAEGRAEQGLAGRAGAGQSRGFAGARQGLGRAEQGLRRVEQCSVARASAAALTALRYRAGARTATLSILTLRAEARAVSLSALGYRAGVQTTTVSALKIPNGVSNTHFERLGALSQGSSSHLERPGAPSGGSISSFERSGQLFCTQGSGFARRAVVLRAGAVFARAQVGTKLQRAQSLVGAAREF